MLGTNFQPPKNVVLRFGAQALLPIRQKTTDRCSRRQSWSIDEHDLDLIARLQIVHSSLLPITPAFSAIAPYFAARVSRGFLGRRQRDGSFAGEHAEHEGFLKI